MKTLGLFVLAILLLLPGSSRAEIDFTLQHQVTEADSITIDQPYVTDGSSRIYLRFSKKWRTLDSAGTLELIPDVADASVRFDNYHGKALTIDEGGARELLQQVVAQLPKEAKNVAAYPPECNPFPISTWKDLRAVVRYELFGVTYRRSVMYVAMKPGRIVEFSVTAPDTDFDKLYKPARSVLANFFEADDSTPADSPVMSAGGGFR